MTYTLYDFEHPRNGHQAFNMNVWKARLTLNYKQLPYRTVFIPLTDAEKTCKAIGAAPTRKYPDGRDWYTIPVLQFPDGSTISDSFNIAKKLDELHPEKIVIPAGTAGFQLLAVDWLVEALNTAGRSIVMWSIVDNFQTGAGKQFMQARCENFKIPRAPAEGTQELEAIWKGIETVLGRVAKYLDEADSGATSFGRGGGPIFFDFAIVGILSFWRDVLLPKDWIRVEAMQGGRWKKMLEDFKPYMDWKRD